MKDGNKLFKGFLVISLLAFACWVAATVGLRVQKSTEQTNKLNDVWNEAFVEDTFFGNETTLRIDTFHNIVAYAKLQRQTVPCTGTPDQKAEGDGTCTALVPNGVTLPPEDDLVSCIIPPEAFLQVVAKHDNPDYAFVRTHEGPDCEAGQKEGDTCCQGALYVMPKETFIRGGSLSDDPDTQREIVLQGRRTVEALLAK